MKPKKLKIKKENLRELKPSTRYFDSLVRAIIYQQISGKAGDAIMKKFLGLFGRKKLSPQLLGMLTDEQFQGAGVSPQKRGYLRDLAARFLDKTIEPKKIPTMTDDEIVSHLLQVKGVGLWTAQMFLIFTLARPNVLPTGDLAIRKGFVKAFNLGSTPSHEEMVKLAAAHRGEWTYLSLYLWQLIDEERKIKKASISKS